MRKRITVYIIIRRTENEYWADIKKSSKHSFEPLAVYHKGSRSGSDMLKIHLRNGKRRAVLLSRFDRHCEICTAICAKTLYQRGGYMSTVEEVVIDIQNGVNRKNELYGAIYKYLYQLCKRYLRFASQFGWELDDLLSAAWLGVERAINSFDRDKEYKFITYLKYHVNNTVREFLGIRNGKQVYQHYSLDAEISGTDGLTYGETIEDETTAEAFEEAENAVYFSPLHSELEKLKPRQKDAIERYFLKGETLSQIALSYNVSDKMIQQDKNKGLRELRKSQRLRDCYYEDYAYSHKTLTNFKRSWTSSTEWAALQILEAEKELERLQAIINKD